MTNDYLERRMEEHGPAVLLGSLAQSSLLDSLNSPRIIFFVLGALFCLSFSALLPCIDWTVEQMAKDGPQGLQLEPNATPDQIAQAKKFFKRAFVLILSAGIAVGVAFLSLGLVVRRFPVPATITGLVLFMTLIAIVLSSLQTLILFANLCSMTLCILVLILLGYGIRAALLYEQWIRALQLAPTESHPDEDYA